MGGVGLHRLGTINPASGGLSWTITIAAGEVASNLTNFPVYVRMSDLPAPFWAAVAADGGDIRIWDGVTDLPVHILEIDTGTDTGHLFFKAPTLNSGSDNVYTLDLSGGSLPAVGDPNGQYAVWTDYECVYFMNGNFNDAKGDHALATNDTGTPTYTDFECGGGLDISANFQQYVANAVATGTTHTIAVTITQTDFTSVNRQAVTYMPTFNNSANRCCMGHQNITGDPLSQFDSTNSFLDSPNVHSNGVRYRMHGVWNGSTHKKFYVDGVNVATDSTISAIGSTSDTLTIGGNGASSGYWRGKIGFVYLRQTALSGDWIAAEASNLAAPSSFYAIT